VSEELVDLCVEDLRAAFKLPRIPALLRALRPPARRFADEILEFDAEVGHRGILGGAQFILNRFSGSVQVFGEEDVTSSGPVLLASNHPGMADAMAIWAKVGRPDLKTLAADKPLLRLLPNTLKNLILIDGQGTHAIRETVAHLEQGGAVLTFPAGRIEPDPASAQGSENSILSWSSSVDLFVRQAPATRVHPVVVSGVISTAALANPFLRFIRNPADRAWAAATLQVLRPGLRRVPIEVRIGPATPSKELIEAAIGLLPR